MRLNIRIFVLCYLAVTASAQQFLTAEDVMVEEKQAPIGEAVCTL